MIKIEIFLKSMNKWSYNYKNVKKNNQLSIRAVLNIILTHRLHLFTKKHAKWSPFFRGLSIERTLPNAENHQRKFDSQS